MRDEVGLPSGLGAKGRMLIVERVGIALADFVETWPGRRAGERGEGKGGSRECRRRFLSDCVDSTLPVEEGSEGMGMVATVGWPDGWMVEWRYL